MEYICTVCPGVCLTLSGGDSDVSFTLPFIEKDFSLPPECLVFPVWTACWSFVGKGFHVL